MTFYYKNREELVRDVINQLMLTLPPNTDYSTGEPLRTIVEAVMHELELQYWQMEQVYNSGFIDTAAGDDLDKLVKLLGVYRNTGVKSIGVAEFYRQTPASEDYFIEAGTLVSTLPNSEGETFTFETIGNAMIKVGEYNTLVPIQALEPGSKYNLAPNTITIINTPPIGVESVINRQGTDGGFDIESDESLRERAENKLEATGLGTVGALTYHLSNIPLIEKVQVYEMLRGIGTVDIIVLADSIPMPADLFKECQRVTDETRAAGIDVVVYEPNVIYIDVDAVLSMEGKFEVETFELEAIKQVDKYVNNLNTGQTMILNQLERSILNVSERIRDIKITTINSNITAEFNQVIRTRSITVR